MIPFRRRRVSGLLMSGLLCVGTLSTPARITASEPALPDTPRPSPLVTTQAAGETHRFVDQFGDEVFAVEDGFDLDQYLYQSSSPLNFAIDVPPDLGPVNAAGHPIQGHPLFDQVASLTLRAFDVDEDGAQGIQPERDLIVVNGTTIPGKYLHGADNQWRSTTVLFPAFLLRFKTQDNPNGTNAFEIDIDSLHNVDTWAVEVDRAELRLGIDPSARRPTTLLHGLHSNSAAMGPMEAYFEGHGEFLQGRIATPDMTFNDAISANVALATPVIDDLLADTGSDAVNLVGHSLGGFTARKYAADHPDRVSTVIMIGTPNGGTKFADTICALLEHPFYGDFIRDGEAFPDEIKRCDEGSAVFNLRRTYIRDTFNVAVRDVLEVSYLTMGGDIPEPETLEEHGATYYFFHRLEEKPNDGLVPLSSVQYLRPDDPEHPGLQIPTAPYPLDHSQLVFDGSAAIADSFCYVYPSAPDCGAQAVTASHAGAAQQAEDVSELLRPIVATVTANGFVDVPLSFENATSAVVTVFPGDPDVTAQFGSTALPSSTFLSVPVLEGKLVDPSDGALRVVNPNAVATDIAVFVSIETARHLSIVPAATLSAVGQAVPIEVVLSAPLGGETPTAFATLNGGAPVSLTLTPAGGGRWTTTYTPTAAGFVSLGAATGEPGTRFASSLVTVSSGAATIGAGFGEQLTGQEDGLADALVLSPTVSVGSAGVYRIAGDLVDSAGIRVGSANSMANLTPGSHLLDLTFDGRTIYESGRPGPYRLVNVVLASEGPSIRIEDRRADLGATAAYGLGTFQHFPILFDLDSFGDVLQDATGDDVIDLVISASVTVEEAGPYALNAGLLAPDDTEVARFQATPTLAVGANSVTLVFDGTAIAAAGRDGPYRLFDLSLYPLSDAQTLGYLMHPYTTPPYLASQFSEVDTWGASVRVNDDSGAFLQDGPAVAINESGAAAVAWSDSRLASGPDVYFSLRNPASGTWGPNQRVNSVTTRSQSAPALVLDATNRAVAAWTDTRNGSSDPDIYAATRSSAGAWSAAVRVNDDGAGRDQNSASLDVAPNGDVIAVWVDRRGSGNRWHVYSARLPAGASTWSANLRVTTNDSTTKAAPKITITPDGTAHAVWVDARTGKAEIWYASLPPGGTTWSANTMLSDTSAQTYSADAPKVGSDAVGRLMVVWRHVGGFTFSARYRTKVPTGSWSETGYVSGIIHNGPNDLSVRPDGRAYYVSGEYPSMAAKTGSEYDPVSGTWSPPEALNDTGRTSGSTSVAFGSDVLIVAWVDTVSGTDKDIRIRVRE